MNRRHFLTSAIAAAAATHSPARADNAPKFKLKYAPHPGMFRHSAGASAVDQIQFASDQGFTAWEDNDAMKREPAEQDAIGRALEKNGMTMGVFVARAEFQSNDFMTRADDEFRNALRATMRDAVATARRVGSKWTTVVPGTVNQNLDTGYQTAHCIENLRVMTEVAEPAGLVIVLEPLNWYRDHPGLFLRSVPQAYAICKAVDSPSCKILDDLYHQQIQVGNLIPNMEQAWDEIAYIQVGDNPGRKEPTTGEINYRNIFRWLHERGSELVIGMEHGNSKPGKEGEKAVIAAYRACDDF